MKSDSTAQFLLNPETTRMQSGALCWRVVRDEVQVLLVTSRDTGRWVIPKGWPVPGLSAAASAAREAWEEAGVEGSVSESPVGLFPYDKVMGPTLSIPCLVTVFPLKVLLLRSRYPEAKQRKRKWFGLKKAATKVDEPGLRTILRHFAPEAPAPAAELVAPASRVAGQS